MKRMLKFAGVVVLVFGTLALGISQYMSRDERGRTTDMAADALNAMANAASRWSADKNEYTVIVSNRVGNGRVGDDREAPMAVQAMIAVRGGEHLSRMCATMPRVRDAIYAVVTDRIGPKLRAGRALAADELAADGEILRAALDRVIDPEAVLNVRLVLRAAYDAQESGCNEATKTANNTRH